MSWLDVVASIHFWTPPNPNGTPPTPGDRKFLFIGSGSMPFINIANANSARLPLPANVDFPPIALFVVRKTAQGLPARNLRESKAEWDRRWPDRHADQHDFWEWKRQGYMLVNPHHARPFGQPLIASCTGSLRPDSKGERRCTVQFYWTLATSVEYGFYDSDIPQSKWIDLDRRVIELLQLLDGRGVGHLL